MTEPPDPYMFCFHEVSDAADAQTFLNRWHREGYDYVEGLPRFYADPEKNPPSGLIVHVLFKRRR